MKRRAKVHAVDGRDPGDGVVPAGGIVEAREQADCKVQVHQMDGRVRGLPKEVRREGATGDERGGGNAALKVGAFAAAAARCGVERSKVAHQWIWGEGTER